MLCLPAFLFAATICVRAAKLRVAVRRINSIGSARNGKAHDEKCVVVATRIRLQHGSRVDGFGALQFRKRVDGFASFLLGEA